MIVVDSSGWLEFLTDGPLANDFARRLREPKLRPDAGDRVYEVYKHTRRLRSEDAEYKLLSVLSMFVRRNGDAGGTSTDAAPDHDS